MSEADAVLSTLCGICHSNKPKYKCPRCGARTCSLPCTQKHKTRADCDGVRNPRAFLPLPQLRTAAGIDHDFNFISSIERARQRAEKDIVEARRLLSEKDLRPEDEDRHFRKVWRGDELHYLPAGHAQDGEGTRDGPDRNIRRRAGKLDIEVVSMPKGMVRQRENMTAWNRRTLSINWQVEWLVFADASCSGAQGLPQMLQHHENPVRILHKTLERKPLNEALATALEWYRGQLDRQNREQYDDGDSDVVEEHPKKHKRRSRGKKQTHVAAAQDPIPTIWSRNSYCLQSPLTGAWSQTSHLASVPAIAGVDAALFEGWQFFLLRVPKPPATSKGKGLIPIPSTDTLAVALSGRTVVEFPTVYVLPPEQPLPEGFTLAPHERPKRKIEESHEDSKEAASQPPLKKQGFQRDQHQDNVRWESRGGRGRGGQRGRGGRGGRGNRGGGGERRVIFERQAAVKDEDSADEGQINSDGDDMDVDFENMILAASRPDYHALVAGGGQESQGPGDAASRGCEKPAGGLVDYESSGDSD